MVIQIFIIGKITANFSFTSVGLNQNYGFFFTLEYDVNNQ